MVEISFLVGRDGSWRDGKFCPVNCEEVHDRIPSGLVHFRIEICLARVSNLLVLGSRVVVSTRPAPGPSALWRPQTQNLHHRPVVHAKVSSYHTT